MHGSGGKSPADLLKRYGESPEEFRSDFDEFLSPLPQYMRDTIYREIEGAVQRGDVKVFTKCINLANAMREYQVMINKHGGHNQYSE